MKAYFVVFSVAFVLIFGDELATTSAITITNGKDAELISLYDEQDPIIELVAANITNAIQDPDQVWFVEFYAHWCGHCQRFSPVWKALAEEFDGKCYLERSEAKKVWLAKLAATICTYCTYVF